MTRKDEQSHNQQQNPNEREQNPHDTSAYRGDNNPASARDLGELVRSALKEYHKPKE